jgi:NAD(P)-dependent dehydrogenase (short-subunit alcohol dehydrogenase family)
LDREFGRIDFLGNVAGEAVLGRPEEIALADVEKTWRNSSMAAFAAARKRAGGCSRRGAGAS